MRVSAMGVGTTRFTFRSMPAVSSYTFTCPACKKGDRRRTFRADCTVNPFNKNEDGTVKSPAEVRRQSQEQAGAELERFTREPLCRTCEEKLTYTERRALHLRRGGK